ncbi:MAG: Uma2 family endonuclease [Phormidesmis sp. CAN_BIN36]|nr:Uma2 family endonuclease [Phormidesmis sp. CAN_BIN36]
MALTLKDLEAYQVLNPDNQVELVNGEIIIMSPSGYESEEVASRMLGKLFPHVEQNRLGRVTGSSAGFVLPNSDTRAPDVSFVLAERMRRTSRKFAELAPDLMVEVKSPTDDLAKLREKVNSFLSQGTKVGILINPEERWVEVKRSSNEAFPLKLVDGDKLEIPDLFPGWEVPVTELWPPEF